MIYPAARDEHDQLVRIESYRKGTPVFCLGCACPMIGRQGDQNAWHFAHAVDADNESCSGESALHLAAKLAICQAHAADLRAFLWNCDRCRTVQRYSIDDLTLQREDYPCEEVRSDVLCRDRDDLPRLAIEVVVTNPMSVQTRARYLEMGLPVGIVKPTWDWIAELPLDPETFFHDLLDGAPCAGCERHRVDTWWRDFGGFWPAVVQRAALDAQQAEAARLRKIQHWWDTWNHTWKLIVFDIYIVCRRIHVWWQAWDDLWKYIYEKKIHEWYTAWILLWKDVGQEGYDVWARLWKTFGEEELRRAAQWDAWRHAWQHAWTMIGGCHHIRCNTTSYPGYDPRWIHLERYGGHLDQPSLERLVIEMLNDYFKKVPSKRSA